MRHVFSLITCASAALIAVAVASCSGTGVSGTSNFGGQAGSGTTSAHGGAGTGGSTGTLNLGGSGGSGGSCPTKTTCAKAGADCGSVPHACGGVLPCGTCTAP